MGHLIENTWALMPGMLKDFIVIFNIVYIGIIRIYLQNDHGSLACREVPYEFM